MTVLRFLLKLGSDDAGAAAIESAFVLPILLTMSLGGVEVSQIAARHTEMRAAASEAVAIALATPGNSEDYIDTIEDIVEASTGLADDDVELAEVYRCNAPEEFDSDGNPIDDPNLLIEDKDDCDEDDPISTFLEIEMTDTYSPVWTEFGVGDDVDLAVTRLVQIS